MMKIVCVVMTAILVLGGLVSCFSEEDADHVYKDILAEYDGMTTSHKATTFQVDILWKDEGLGHGWSISERTHRWAVGLESTLQFPANGQKNFTLRVRCWSPPYSKTPQTLHVRLNHHDVGTITLHQQERVYEIALPNDALLSDMNELTFQYAYTQNPCDIGESQDCRDLSAAFDLLEFESASEVPELKLSNGTLEQLPQTAFDYYTLLPENASLRLDMKKSHPFLDGVLEIRSDNLPAQEFRVEHDGSYSYDLAQFAGEIVQIHIKADDTRSDDEQSKDSASPALEWTRMQIVVPPSESEGDSPDIEQGGQHATRYDQFHSYHVIYLVLDAFHATHSSLYGYERKTTPFLDTLAPKSVAFENMFVNSPYTLASTATLFTSRYSHEHGLIDKANRLSPIIPTLSEFLRDAGIETNLMSDVGWLKNPAWGLLRGFSDVFNHKAYSQQIDEVLHELDDVFDEMLHIPFLISFPEALRIPPQRISHPASSIDIAPTLFEIYGLADMPNFLGKSLLPVILGDETSPSPLYSETLLTNARSLRGARYKYITSPTDDTMLFDMADDPLELRNCIENMPVTAGYDAQLMRPYVLQDASLQTIEMNMLDRETLENLENLGHPSSAPVGLANPTGKTVWIWQSTPSMKDAESGVY